MVKCNQLTSLPFKGLINGDHIDSESLVDSFGEPSLSWLRLFCTANCNMTLGWCTLVRFMCNNRLQWCNMFVTGLWYREHWTVIVTILYYNTKFTQRSRSRKTRTGVLYFTLSLIMISHFCSSYCCSCTDQLSSFISVVNYLKLFGLTCRNTS